MTKRSLMHPLCAALALLWGCIARSPTAAQRTQKIVSNEVHRSPDRSLIAKVVFLKQRLYGSTPSRVEIRRADGRLVAQTDYSSIDGQGLTVYKAGWTPDSRFFVYIVSSSGGHGPWHHPIFFYSRKRHRFYSLDSTLAGMGHGDGAITGNMVLRKPCTVFTKGRYYGKSRKGLRTSLEPGDASGDKVLEIDLSRLEAGLGQSKLDSKFHM